MWCPALVSLLAGLTGCDVVFGLSRDKPDGGAPNPTDDAIDAIDAMPNEECIDPSLRLCMLFENDLTLGQAIDSSTQSNHATVSSVIPATRDLERAVEVTATSRIAVAEDTSLDVTIPATISAWFSVSTRPAAGEGMIVFDNDSQYAISIAENDQVSCNAILAGGRIELKQTFSLGAWHHVACVFEQGPPSKMTMYLDGIAVGIATGTGQLGTSGNSGLRIGQNAGGGGLESGPLIGLIDDVKIWARALSAQELEPFRPQD